ncbi:MAG: sugar transferase [Actinobacteria bacterium]|nr:sugar transferase [Actinomycetota bacterium]
MLDIAFVLVMLPIAIPVGLLIALAIVVTDGGPVLYRSTRIGADGNDFSIIKFRTMVRDSEAQLAELRQGEADADREFAETIKLRRDPRVTRLGGVLRKSSLDELPQLLNVLSAQMSLVGPRPVTRHEWDRFYGDQAPFIFRSRPGLTGVWQVSGRSLLPYRQRIQLDLAYAQECRLTTDLGILVRTIPTVLRGHGAF